MINYQLLGRTGLRVAGFCLGTMTFGDDWGWGAAKDEARKIYDYYREQGGNFIDTAKLYTNGTSEKFVGEFIAGHRSEVVLATKYTNAVAGGLATSNRRRNHLGRKYHGMFGMRRQRAIASTTTAGET